MWAPNANNTSKKSFVGPTTTKTDEQSLQNQSKNNKLSMCFVNDFSLPHVMKKGYERFGFCHCRPAYIPNAHWNDLVFAISGLHTSLKLTAFRPVSYLVCCL